MPIEFDDPTAMTPITRRVLMLCDRWSDWTNGRAIINQQLALGLCSYGAVEVYRSVHSPQRKCATLPVIAMINVLRRNKTSTAWIPLLISLTSILA